MRRETAEAICKHALECSRHLNQALGDIEGLVDPDFFSQYKKGVGGVMGSLYFDVLCEVFSQYPDLEPDWEK